MNRKLIIATAAATLTGTALGYYGVLSYGDEASPDRKDKGNGSKGWEDVSSHPSMISNKPSKNKKLLLEEILKERSYYRKDCNLYTYYASIRSDQREEEFQKILALDESQRGKVLKSFFSSWAKQEPRRALETVAKIPDSFVRDELHYYVFSAWAEKNPEAAAAYFLENGDILKEEGIFMIIFHDASVVFGASYSIVENLAKFSPEKALEWIDHIENKQKQTELKDKLISVLAKKDPVALLKNSAQLFPGEENKTYAAIAGQWVKRDPVATQQWIETLPEEEKSIIHQAIVKSLSKDKPLDALAWVQKNLDIKELNSDYQYFLNSALDNVEISEAQQWIQSFPDSPEKYRIMENYASSLDDRNYTEQIEFIFTIPDKSSQNEALGRTLNRWMQDDDVAAKKWLDTTPLEKEDKEFILKKIE